MVTLAVLPGMLRTSLVVADLANPGNSSRVINLLVSQPGIVGLVSALPAHYDRTSPRMLRHQSWSPMSRGFPECRPVDLAGELDLPPCSCSCAGSRAPA